MVSVLGFSRRLLPFSILPDRPRSPAPPPTATCGIELTVSVSTVMFLTDPSPPALLRGELRCVRDFLGRTVVVRMELLVDAGFRPRLPFVFVFPFLLLPLSLPLSVLVRMDLVNASSMGFSVIRSGAALFEVVMLDESGIIPITGVAGRLLSCTVSSVEPVPLTPRPGVRIPERGVVSSLSISVVLAEISVTTVGDGVACSIRMLGVLAPWSELRGEKTDGFMEVAEGGGDFSLGDVGQRGDFRPGAPFPCFLALAVSADGSVVIGVGI